MEFAAAIAFAEQLVEGVPDGVKANSIAKSLGFPRKLTLTARVEQRVRTSVV